MAAWVAMRRNVRATRDLGDNWLHQGAALAAAISPGLRYLFTIAGLRGESL
jgi:hypothetical protein